MLFKVVLNCGLGFVTECVGRFSLGLRFEFCFGL